MIQTHRLHPTVSVMVLHNATCPARPRWGPLRWPRPPPMWDGGEHEQLRAPITAVIVRLQGRGSAGQPAGVGKPQLRRLQLAGRPAHVRHEVRKLCCSLEDGQRHGERSMGTGACWRRLRPATRTMAARQNCAYRVHCMAAVGAPERCPAPARSFATGSAGFPRPSGRSYV